MAYNLNVQKLLNLYKKYEKTIRKIADDLIPSRATEAAFFVIISIVPFVMFLLSLLRYVMPLNLKEIELILNNHLPESISYWVNAIIASIYTDATISLTSVTAIIAIWAASKSVYALAKGICKIYEAPARTRNIFFLRAYTYLFTILMAISFSLSLLLLVFSTQLTVFLDQILPASLLWIVGLLPETILFFLIFMSLVFAVLYKYLSLSKIPFHKHLPGALFSSVGWLLFSKFFSIYIDDYANFSLTYGPLTTVVLMMLWLQICMQILLYGAELNVFLFKNEQGDQRAIE